ncbi:uncharacterized protein JCM6883_006633 [Sporobolomyces salmoneus]|uniref:uncharacterized protein n=1 Tax=Sporobolomyces salmoneus TaxID=183962 RepID=UPI00316D99D5
MFFLHELHNPRSILPNGPRTATHFANTINPLLSNRSAHITRLYSILLHLLSLEPSYSNSTRLLRTWRALAGCKEVHLGVLWRTGTAVLERMRGRGEEEDEEEEREQRKADWLKFVQEGKLEKIDKFNEYILALVAAGNAQFALDELESYLDNQPYHDSITLNSLSGQLSLLLAQPGPSLVRPTVPSSASSSSSDDDEGTTRGNRRRQGGRNEKRVKNSIDSSPDDELLSFLQSLAQNSPALFSKAKERFKRAAQLEERLQKENETETVSVQPGEAVRWLNLIDRSEKLAARDGSPL